MGRDTNFYYSFLVLPAEQRRALVAVWDLCRAVDDVADEPAAGERRPPHEVLDWWRDELARCFGGGSPQSPQAVALQPWIERFGLPRQPFEELIDGVAMDLVPRRYATFAELEQYCHAVASTVGLICLEIFGYQNPRAREYAAELGLALQLTNILRDVGKDLAAGRLYIPLDELAQFDCPEDELRAGVVTGRVARLLAHQAARAHRSYARTAQLLPREDATRLVAAEIMSGIYQAILAKIETRGYDVFSEVVRVPRPRRALIAASIWLRVRLGVDRAVSPTRDSRID
jgi:phytoene synthase